MLTNSGDDTKLHNAEFRAKAKRRDKAHEKQRTNPYSRSNEFGKKKLKKNEGFSEAMNYVFKDGFIIKFDLTSGYHHKVYMRTK